VQRYQAEGIGSPHATWRFNHKLRTMPVGKTLRVEVPAPARVRWSADDWRTSRDLSTRDSGLGLHVADLPTNRLPAGTTLVFTLHWPGDGRWEDADFAIEVVASGTG
jgi:glucoamylase